jgi:hypothetical protein
VTAPMDAAVRPVWQMTDAELIAEAEAINRAEDRAALTDPAALMRHLSPGYKRRAHLRKIGQELAEVGAGRVKRLLITTPPQVGKTVTAVVGNAFWWLANNPGHRVIIGSYGVNLAVNRGRSIRKMVIEHGHRYDLTLERGASSAAEWELTSGGGVKSVGVGAGVTGSPGDIALIDDPHKSRAEADSLRIRDKVYDWYSGDLVSRLAPGAPIILILTRWHPDDLAARVLKDEGREDEGGRWRVVHIPALSLGPLVDPLGRPTGEPLPHPKIKPSDRDGALQHWREKRQASTVRDWFALYMGDPKPAEGALVTRDLLKERRCYQNAPNPDYRCADPVKAAVAVDPSGGGRDTAGVIGGYLGTDKRLYITHDSSKAMSSEEWSRAACALAVEIDADRIIFESNYGGDMGKLAIRTAWDTLRREEIDALRGDVPAETFEQTAAYTLVAKFARLPPRIVAVHARKNKLLRAEPIAQQWIVDRIRTAAYLPEMEEEWATWQPDQTDSPGRIDASVYLAYGLLPPPPLAGGAAPPPTGTLPTTGLGPLGGGIR